MKRILFSLLATTLLFGSAIAVGYRFLSEKNTVEQFATLNNSPMTPQNDHEKAWQEIDSLAGIGLYRQALDKTEALFAVIQREDDPAQLVKVHLYRNTFQMALEEEGLAKSIVRMEAAAAAAPEPARSVLYSLVGEMYCRYMEQNQWQLEDRTTVADTVSQEDLLAWDLSRLSARAGACYAKSLESPVTRSFKVEDFQAALVLDLSAAPRRPFLYDVLAHRAVSYYVDSRNFLTEPAYAFVIDQPVALGPVEDFVKYKFVARDSTSGRYRALLVFQQILAYHLRDKDPTALVDADLLRLAFVKGENAIADADALYETVLERMRRKYISHPAHGEIAVKLAERLAERATAFKPTKGNLEHPNKWDYKKAVAILDDAIGRFPKSYGAVLCENLRQTILYKSLSAKTEEVMPLGQATLVCVDYRNLDALHCRLYPVSDEVYERLKGQWNEDFFKSLGNLQYTAQWTVDLPNDGDCHAHSTEIMAPAQKTAGRYLLVLSAKPDFSLEQNGMAHVFYCHSNLAYFYQQNNSQQNFHVVDRISGAPLEGVKAEVFQSQYQRDNGKYKWVKTGTFTTDKNGFFSPENQAREQYSIKFSKGSDVLSLYEGFVNYRYDQREPEAEQVHFFLDRGIYRPGQTIYFKGLLLKGKGRDWAVVKNAVRKVKLYDANYQVVSELELRTNEFGTYQGTFVAPTSGALGYFQIIDGASRQGFRVEEYKRPKFEVVFEPVKGAFRLGEKITVKGNAKAYAGNAIDGAKVAYRVVRQAYFPYWRWWEWGGYIPYRTESMEIGNGTVQTQPDGSFEVGFELVGDPTIPKTAKPQYTYQVFADVTDLGGETRSGETSVTAGHIALVAGFDLPEKAHSDSLRAVVFSATNLSGQPEATELNFKIESLKVPAQPYRKRLWELPDQFTLGKKAFQAAFPTYAFDGEDGPPQWPVEQLLVNAVVNTGKNPSFALPKRLGTGHYRATVTGKDKYGESIELVHYFQVADPLAKTVPGGSNLFVLAPTNDFEPGQKFVLYAGSAAKDAQMLFEIEHEGKIVTRQWLRAKGGQPLIIPIEEKHRGNFGYHLVSVHDNRLSAETGAISVPWTNKELRFEYLSFRDKLLPGQPEEWRIKITGAKAEAFAAEMVATMYDASLDAFAGNSWGFWPYPSEYPSFSHNGGRGFQVSQGNNTDFDWNPFVDNVFPDYPQFNWFGFNFYNYQYYSLDAVSVMRGEGAMPAPTMAPSPGNGDLRTKTVAMAEKSREVGEVQQEDIGKDASPATPAGGSPGGPGPVKVRTNLNETVFFFPQLMTDASGNIILKFTMNEALTRWRFMGFAHTQDLKLGWTEKTVVTQKELMVVPNAPRFLREGDQMNFSAKVSNLSEKTLDGKAKLELLDALTMQPVDAAFGNAAPEIGFTAQAGQSAALSWAINIPVGWSNPVTYRVVAQAGDYSDGEENVLPVVTNRMLVTETMPLPLRGGQTRTFDFGRMRTAGSSPTLQQHRFTLEFTSNPAWYAVQSLPYLMEYPYECTEQVFNRFYANSLASTVANSHPKVRQVFERWKGTDAMLSNLSKNEELKTALLEETPWVLQAQNEEQQKQRIGLLFDLNRMSNELGRAVDKLAERQQGNGGFAWFSGGPDDPYITQYLTEGIGHLDRLGAKIFKEYPKMAKMAELAVLYTDARILERYKRIKKEDLDKDNLDYMATHWLYARSFYLSGGSGELKVVAFSEETKKVHEYYLAQAEKYWNTRGHYAKGMIALAAHRSGKSALATQIVNALREQALVSEEMGMYWNTDRGWFWYQMPIETHALLIEVFDEVANDAKTVDELKIWLLKNKQTNSWETTKGTASAVYALLLRGDNWLLEDQNVAITLGGQALDVAAIPKEAGTGYFKKAWTGQEIKPEMGQITVQNPNKNPAWGAVYWQYFEQMDKITQFKETPLKLDKRLFKQVNTDRGPQLVPVDANTPLQVGDLVKVRVELRADRDMEYVQLKDMRGAGFEPTNVLSQYKWQGGLGYFESTRDLSTSFFIGYLPKGTYVFEYPLRVTHKGDFSTGISTIQCMYAPEFTAHSEGIRVKVK